MIANWEFNKFKTDYKVQKSKFSQILWYFTNAIIFKSAIFPINKLKIVLLKGFGAKIGVGCIIKPNVNIKYPWELKLGDNVWIGENVWIDNLATVSIGSNSCLSQGVTFITGTHDFTSTQFETITKPIQIGSNVWIGAKSTVGPGVELCDFVIISMGATITISIEAEGIYQINGPRRVY
jgi:putative colanic acid biosynthesis acetyltransferase WcaF